MFEPPIHRTLFLAAVVLVVACAPAAPPASAPTADRAQPVSPAEVVFVNGNFATLDEQSSRAEAVAIRDGRFIVVGSAEEVAAVTGPRTRVVDVGGRLVVPGFYDNHVHIRTGRDPSVQQWEHIDSRESLLAAVERRAGEIEPGEWIRARLSTEALPDQILPRIGDVDRVAPRNPVALDRMHVWVVNSLALEAAGIGPDVADPPGGQFSRDERGRLDGLVRETPAQRQIAAAIPEWRPDPETARANLRESLEQFLAHGITSVNVAGVRPYEAGWVQDVYERWGEDLPRTTLQIRLRPGFDEYDDLDTAVETELAYLEGFRFRTGIGNDRFKLGAIKMSVDGGMTGQSAWTRHPYRDRHDWTGTVRIPEEALYAVSRRAHELGWQVGIHAIGDAAVESAIRVLDQAIGANPRDDHRHYLHHWSVQPSEAAISTVARRGIIVSSQPNFTYSLAPYYSQALEGERLQTNNPQASLLERGVRMSYGSDGLPLGPFIGLYAAVTRRAIDGEVYGPGERIDLETALRLYTSGTAYMTFDEEDRGSIEVGKLADLTVVAEDIFTLAPEDLLHVQPHMTIVGGRILWSADGEHATDTRSAR